MKQLLVLAPIVAILAACSSAPKDTYERRAYDERERQEKLADRAIDKAPKWMMELPQSKSAIYQNGSATSYDMSMSLNKAKTVAFGKICMSAGGRVDQQSKLYRLDSANASTENSEVAIRSMCRRVDITGAETVDTVRISENGRFRTYVLVALPTGDANKLQTRKDQQRAGKNAAERSERAFNELDKN